MAEPDRPWARFILRLTLLEVGHSLKSAHDHTVVFGSGVMRNLMEASLSSDVATTALDIEHRFLPRGQHRGPSLPDLLTSALGHLGGHTIVHDDSDFDIVYEITGQPLETLRSGHQGAPVLSAVTPQKAVAGVCW